MGSRIKEDERIEKAVRSLLKLPENRRCINCNSLGPQYVCSTFWTFVCTNCSGIHREFTHRVKSVSMAKFTADEVGALRAGGNERARQIYFKEWDTHRDGYPDGSNIFKLRDFIRNVYVDKRYCSESNDSRQKSAVVEDYRESKKASANSLGSRSLHSVDKSETERSSAVGRSGSESLKFYFDDKNHRQQHATHNPRSRGLPKSPIRFEIVDDRFRDDGSVKRYDARKESRGSSKSLDLSSNKDMPRFPIVRHTSELLGDSAPRLRVSNVAKIEKKKDPVNNQMTEKMESPRSLIDDEPVSEPSASLKTTEGPAPNSLEALLFGLSVPSVVPGTNKSEQCSTSDISSTVSVDNYPAANFGIQTMPITPDSVTSFVASPTIAHAHAASPSPLFPVAADNLVTKETATPSVATNNQEQSDSTTEQSTLAITNYAHGGGYEQQYQDETHSSVREALPEDLFTGGFSFAPQQAHGQHHSMGYGMQYYQYPMAVGALPYTAKAANPFDLSYDDTAPNQIQQFPSMGYVQGGGLPHVSAPIGYADTSSPAAGSIGLMTSQSPFHTAPLSPNSPALASNISPGGLMGQQSHVNMSQSFSSTEGNTFTFHQANNGYPSANPNAYISRGNPFE
ncbi:probable ADP-ribosylation factor GTPase-activating protein AGD14 isoform X1 [Capsella rubella]|uniref:probable ADP-ribosylation factor GTPase-activating protein AGD14 isoform X1 n=1 Tax=Capsella rubella TaxID=81985 RepID=UPI000CD5140E|nr:probable ADP-ribosylation factor GTPase-activating protein AGD14 isoform X1 [Capsella rubella]XP_023635322.1 probable ADP-ribosylation factor GTPase-activating protein AGD14 isoform X1 [Capsella rubella]